MQNSAVPKALADDTRRQIVILLLRHNYCVGALARELNLSKGAVSQHLKVLKEVGLVTGKRKGRLMHYEVSQDALEGLGGRDREAGLHPAAASAFHLPGMSA